jgi:hypothetical protein
MSRMSPANQLQSPVAQGRGGRKYVLLGTAALVLLWSVLVVAGFYRIETYGQTAGRTGAVADHWPGATALRLDKSVPTLVLFVHPHCPCSRATLGELEVLVAHCRDRVAAQVVFLQPAGFSTEWVESDLWHTAARLPGVAVFRDELGREMERFGARVSGEALLYQTSGELMFHGGITASRGHHGDNTGRETIETLLARKRTLTGGTPVFGCPLRDRQHCRVEEN